MELKDCKNTTELEALVNSILGDLADNSETYQETADRLAEIDADLSKFMAKAEARWFELEQ